jgi:hypothetical protein
VGNAPFVEALRPAPLRRFVRANVIVGASAVVLGIWMLAAGTDF